MSEQTSWYNRNKRGHKYFVCVVDENGRFKGFVSHEDKKALKENVKIEEVQAFGHIFDGNYPNLRVKGKHYGIID